MKNILIYTVLTFLIAPLFENVISAQKPHFIYDAGFEFRFDNREYDASSYSKSMTVFGARITPEIGMVISPKGSKSSHSLMIGADVLKDFGSPKIYAEMVLFYRWNTRFNKTEMNLTAGIFPRKNLDGAYSNIFFSDSLRFYDNNIEGLLLQFSRPNAYYEIGCDWMGKYGENRRERFLIFGHGHAQLTRFLKLGVTASVLHYAGSEQVKGVVDNILLNPCISLDFATMIKGTFQMQQLSLSLGYIQALQNDRINVGHYVFPKAGECVLSLRNWNVGIENRFLYGSDFMPYYDKIDAAGQKYGHNLYFGDVFYRMGRNGIYDRLELYYAPNIASFVQLKVAAVFHFNDAFSGWQQVVSINFNFAGKILSKGKKCRMTRLSLN